MQMSCNEAPRKPIGQCEALLRGLHPPVQVRCGANSTAVVCGQGVPSRQKSKLSLGNVGHIDLVLRGFRCALQKSAEDTGKVYVH